MSRLGRSDRETLRRLLASNANADRVGARVVAKGGAVAIVERFDGPIAYLSNGESLHRTRLRAAPEETEKP